MIALLVPTPGPEWIELPPSAMAIHNGVPMFTAWEHRRIGLKVLRSRSQTHDGGRWIHVSVSLPDRLPTWADLSMVKDAFIGVDREAYQVLAAGRDHVNVHSFCLHLWASLGGERRVANLRDLISEVAV